MTEKTQGLIAAPCTPMDEHGELRLPLVERQAEMLAGSGVAGVFVGGTTGEGPSLTVGERMDLTERWTAVAPPGFRVIVHVGHTCGRDSRTLATHASKAHADGVGSLPPIFFRPRSLDDLVAWSAHVAEAAGELPFYYYHIPSMSGVNFPMRRYLEAAAGAIPHLAGVKFTYEDLMDYALCCQLDGGRFDCLFGRDEILLSALALGARGAIGSTYNLAAPLYRRLIAAFDAGDLATARACQQRSIAMIQAVERHGPGVPGFMEMMRMIGLDLGPVRPPLRGLSADQARALRAELEGIGFFEWCCQ